MGKTELAVFGHELARFGSEWLAKRREFAVFGKWLSA